MSSFSEDWCPKCRSQKVEQEIGTEIFFGTTYRPLLTNNILINVGASILFPNDPAAEFAALRHLSGSGLAPEPETTFDCASGQCLVYAHLPGEDLRGNHRAAGAMLRRLHQTTPPNGLRDHWYGKFRNQST